MFKTTKEGQAKIKVAVADKISKELPVFYNPIMKLNRDLSILVLNNSIAPKNGFNVAEIMAGSGVRSIRLYLECKNIQSISTNDMSKDAIENVKENCELNKIKVIKNSYPDKKNPNKDQIHIFNKDANQFLLESNGFNYIDVDPFGSPNPFLFAASDRIARDGIIAVTATDTSALAGTYANACKRKYWANPIRNELMHEVGLRILIRKCQLVGAQYEKALIPIYSIATDHYMRVFLRCKKGKTKVDEIIKQHEYLLYCSKCANHFTSSENSTEYCNQCGNKKMQSAGPIFTGELWDQKLAEKISQTINSQQLTTIHEESKINTVGFYDIHKLSKILKLSTTPRKKTIFEKVKAKGYNIAVSHTTPYGYKTDMPFCEFVEMIIK